MKISELGKSKYLLKKALKISILVLLFFLIALFIFESVRTKPRDVHFSNITSSSVTVSWNTKYPTSASAIAFEGDSSLPIRLFCFLKEKFFDVRDIRVAELQAASDAGTNRDSSALTMDDLETDGRIKKMGKYYTHNVEITGLNSKMEYSFMVGDTILFRKVKDTEDVSIAKTLEISETVQTPLPAYGLVKDAQNQDVNIDNLSAVKDGIVYFNYLDSITGTRSNLFSSSLNSTGGWYIDIANATDSKGNPFLETYGTTPSIDEADPQFKIELILDAGPNGIWKTTRFEGSSSPADPIIINIPNAIQDENEVGSIVKLSSLTNSLIERVFTTNKVRSSFRDTFVNKVLAARPIEDTPGDCRANECQFIDFCGPCQRYCSDGWWYSCSCPKDTLWSRGCGSPNPDPDPKPIPDPDPDPDPKPIPDPDPIPEVPPTCNGVAIGGVRKSSSTGDCMVCKKITDKIAVFKTDNLHYDPENRCSVRTGCTKSTCDEITNGSYSYEIGECPAGSSCDRSSHTYGDGCGGSKYCLRKSVVPKCSDISDIYKLDPGQCPDGKTCTGVAISYGEGKSKVCYKVNEEKKWVNPLKPILKINAGQGCPDYYKGQELGGCKCNDGIDKNKFVPRGKYCRDVGLSVLLNPLDKYNRVCKAGAQVGDVCSNNGITCAYDTDFPGYRFCNGPIAKLAPSSMSNEEAKERNIFSFFKDLTKDLFAQEGEEETLQYVIDPETHLFIGLPIGTYEVEYNGETYTVDVDETGEEVEVLLYVDVNNDGKYTEDKDINVAKNPSLLKISPLLQEYDYSFKQGFNFVTFPCLVTLDNQPISAAGLLTEWNNTYSDSFYSISKYNGSWKIVGENVEIYDINDFQLIPGEGYVVKTKRDVSVIVEGQPVQYEKPTDKAPITLFKGWNLIGLYGTGVKSYTAKSLIEDINNFDDPDFTADNVSRWESDMQRYDGFQVIDENGATLEYGFDFPVNLLQSYFVRVQEGSGNWQPELSQ